MYWLIYPLGVKVILRLNSSCEINHCLITRRTVEVIFTLMITGWIYLAQSPHVSCTISITQTPGDPKSPFFSPAPKTPGKWVKRDYHHTWSENNPVWFSQWIGLQKPALYFPWYSQLMLNKQYKKSVCCLPCCTRLTLSFPLSYLTIQLFLVF